MVQSAYDAANRGDFAAIPLHEAMRLTVQSPTEGRVTLEGREGVIGFQRRLRETWDDYRIEVEELVDAGDRVFATIVRHGRGRISGAQVSNRLFNVWTFRDGAAVALDSIADRAEALALAGITEQAS